MKKFAALILAVSFVFALCACAPGEETTPELTSEPTIRPTPEPTPEITPTPTVRPKPSKNNLKCFYQGLVESGLLPEATELTTQIVDGYYEGLSEIQLNQCSIHIPTFSISATEIALIEVENSDDVDTVAEIIAKRQENLECSWKDQLPEQYELVKNAKIIQNGRFVLFVAAENADEIENDFKELFE